MPVRDQHLLRLENQGKQASAKVQRPHPPPIPTPRITQGSLFRGLWFISKGELQHLGKYTWFFSLHFYRENRFCHWLSRGHHPTLRLMAGWPISKILLSKQQLGQGPWGRE